MAQQYHKGDEYDLPDGGVAVFDGNDWVRKEAVEKPGKSTWEDIKHGALPWAAQAGAGLAGGLGDVRDLALQGGGKLLGAMGAEAGPKIAEKLREHYRPTTTSGLMDIANKAAPNADLSYQPETRGGQYLQTGMSTVPLAVATSGESILPSVLKGTTSAIGSVEGGNLASRLPESQQWWAKPVGETIGGLLGWGTPAAVRGRVTPHPTDSQTTRQTEMVRALAGDKAVDAAQATNSPKLRRGLGPPDPAQGKMITEGMLKHVGITPDPNLPLNEQVDRHLVGLPREGDAIATQPMKPDKQLMDAWYNRTQAAANNSVPYKGGKLPGDAKDVQKQHNRLVNYFNTQQNPQLSGQQYWKLRNEWMASDSPTIRAMAHDMDDAMGRSNPQAGKAWNDWREKYANTQGLKAAADEAAASGSRVLNPATVFKKIERDTPLKNIAQAAVERQAPIEPAKGAGIVGQAVGAPVSAAIGAAADYGARHFLGAPNDLPGLLMGFGAQHAIAPIAEGMTKGATKAVTKAASPYLENQLWRTPEYGGGYAGEFGTMDPKTAAKVLMLKQPTDAARLQLMIPRRADEDAQQPNQ